PAYLNLEAGPQLHGERRVGRVRIAVEMIDAGFHRVEGVRAPDGNACRTRAQPQVREQAIGPGRVESEDRVGQNQAGLQGNRDILRAKGPGNDGHDAGRGMLADIHSLQFQGRAYFQRVAQWQGIPFVAELKATQSDRRAVFRGSFRVDRQRESFVDVDRAALLQRMGNGSARSAEHTRVESGRTGCGFLSLCGRDHANGKQYRNKQGLVHRATPPGYFRMSVEVNEY